MRKIVDDVKDMSMCELADNCMFIKNGEAWYRNFNEEMPFRDLMRKLIKYHVPSEDIYEDIDDMDDESFDDMMLTDYGALADWESIEFVLAVFYMMGCGMAEVREWLKEYEEDYCSKGEIDMNIEKAKAEIIEKIKNRKKISD